ncbi:hypothetical protein MMC20_002642 [Loxospora ochrophaea]|nr:hypothetical protein [Loxospora ochrophaea]
MADPLYELLVPYIDSLSSSRQTLHDGDSSVSKYLSRLSTLSLEGLTTTEPQSVAQSLQSSLLSLQSLSARSSKSIITSADNLTSLRTTLPSVSVEAENLRDGISTLDKAAVTFATRYSRSSENEVLDRRKRALMMTRNVDRLSDILDLPTLLSSAISSSTSQGASSTANYASALDLHSHIKRLHLLYQDSATVAAVYTQAEDAMREMTSNLIASLRAQGLKLAAAMRTIGYLRRIAPELDGHSKQSGTKTSEGSLGALFLICRLANLTSMLEALSPLRELADQETHRRLQGKDTIINGNAWAGGQQTERYLKRYIEIFREQSFAIISMYQSIFPSAEPTNLDDIGFQFKSRDLKRSTSPTHPHPQNDPLHPLPSALSTFPMHLVDLLTNTLKQYMPNIRDKSSRESLLTQVLYCAGSLGRLHGDFSMILALLNEDEDGDEDSTEWVEIMKKHRELSARLETLTSSMATTSKHHIDVSNTSLKAPPSPKLAK